MLQNARQKITDVKDSFKNRIIEIRQGSGLLKFAAYGSLFLIVLFIILLILDYTAVLNLKLVNRNPPSTFDTIDITTKGTFKDIVSTDNAEFNNLTAKKITSDVIKTLNDRVAFNKTLQIGTEKKPLKQPMTIYGPLSVRATTNIAGKLDAESIAALRVESKTKKDKDGKIQMQDLVLSGKTIQVEDPLVTNKILVKNSASIEELKTDSVQSNSISADKFEIKGNMLQLTGGSSDKEYRALVKDNNRLIINSGGDYISGVRVHGVGMYIPDGEVQAVRARLKYGFGPYQLQVGKKGNTKCIDASMFDANLTGVNICDIQSNTQKWIYDPIKRKIYNPNTDKCIRAGSSAWTIDKCQDEEFEQSLVVLANDTLYNRETETCFDMSTPSRSQRCSINDKGTDNQRIRLIEPKNKKEEEIERINKISEKTLKVLKKNKK